VDHHTRPLPDQWYYNDVGGNRGFVLDESHATFAVSRPTASSYRVRLSSLLSGASSAFCGGWYAIGRDGSALPRFTPSAMLHPMICTPFQVRLVGVDIGVRGFTSPSNSPALSLGLELKGFTAGGAETLRWQATVASGAILKSATYPTNFSASISPAGIEDVGMISWILGGARVDDAIDVDCIRLLIDSPSLAPDVQAVVWPLSHLLYNYDESSGMVGDRSNFPDRAYENVTATAKLAKLLALAIHLGLVDPAQARAVIVNIATAILSRVPRGPAGVNQLLPHFTRNGGMERHPGSEWASGDTAYAILDLIVALHLTDDPGSRIADALNLLRSINWNALYAPDGCFYHGYGPDGTLLTSTWAGFGAETYGVLLASLVGGGPLGTISPPPTANGAGFIPHASYPIPLNGLDAWSNLWSSARASEASLQLGWYSNPSSLNAHMTNLSWFGLSAAEPPSGIGYEEYGIGGPSIPPNDGDHSIVTPHYAAMIAPLEPLASRKMWRALVDQGLMTPLNHAESIAVDPVTGDMTLNSLKGSWNLALEVEGWMLALPGTADLLLEAFRSIPELSEANEQIFPLRPLPLADWEADSHLPANKGGLRVHAHFAATEYLLEGVAFGQSNFVAVGANGQILRSDRGRTWLPIPSGVTNHLLDVTWGNGRFVAVGSHGTILVSPDGYAWQPVGAGITTNDLHAVAAQSNIWVIAGAQGTILRSTAPDAIWGKVPSGTTSNLHDVAFGAGEIVIAGEALFVSPDGLSWAELPSPLSPDEGFTGVAYGHGMYMGAVRRWMYGYSNGQVVYASTLPLIYVSPDARHWAVRPLPNWGLGDTYRGGFAGGAFVVLDDIVLGIGTEGTVSVEQWLFTSMDAGSWAPSRMILRWENGAPGDQLLNRGARLNAVAYGDGLLVAVGYRGLMLARIRPGLSLSQSPDGRPNRGLLFGGWGETCTVEVSSNLVHWAALLHTNIVDQPVPFVDPADVADRARFYRAVMP
jgi:hypothetical protein